MYIHNKDGYAVQLLSQDAQSNVTYSQDGGEPITVPSHEFFGAFHEQTGEEREAGENKAAKADKKAADDKAGEKKPT